MGCGAQGPRQGQKGMGCLCHRCHSEAVDTPGQESLASEAELKKKR